VAGTNANAVTVLRTATLVTGMKGRSFSAWLKLRERGRY